MSLKVATDMSLSLLEKNYPDDVKLLYCLSCLPGGIQEQELSELLGALDFDSLARLKGMGFFEVSAKKIVLIPSIIEPLHNCVDVDTSRETLKIICEYYLNFLKEFY